jgi:hypothetical protein
MLNIAHEVIMASLNSCEPHSCTCMNLDNIMSCANPCCSKESQSSIEQKSAWKINRNKKAKQLRRRRLAQHPQDIHGLMVKKLEKGETAARVKLHKKQVPTTTREANKKNKKKCETSSINVVCSNDLFMSSKSIKKRGKRRCFKCKELVHFIASCLHMDTKNEVRSYFTCNKEDHMITSCPLMKNQGRASPKMTLIKTKNEQQASYQTERRFCYKCGEQGHLCKVCTKSKVPKPRNSFIFICLGDLLGRRRRRHPSLDAFADLTEPTEAKRPAVSTLRPICYKTKAYDEVAPSRGLVQREGPRRIRPIVIGPARLSALRARFVKAFL